MTEWNNDIHVVSIRLDTVLPCGGYPVVPKGPHKNHVDTLHRRHGGGPANHQPGAAGGWWSLAVAKLWLLHPRMLIGFFIHILIICFDCVRSQMSTMITGYTICKSHRVTWLPVALQVMLA